MIKRQKGERSLRESRLNDEELRRISGGLGYSEIVTKPAKIERKETIPTPIKRRQ